MKVSDLIEKGLIGIEDNIGFETKSEIMRLFGYRRYNSQSAFYRHPHEAGVHIWFPVFYHDDTNEWENRHSQDWERVFEQRLTKNDHHMAKLDARPDQQVRVMFAKEKPFGRLIHRFRGVYTYDPELSAQARKAAYIRTSLRAKLYVN